MCNARGGFNVPISFQRVFDAFMCVCVLLCLADTHKHILGDTNLCLNFENFKFKSEIECLYTLHYILFCMRN